MITASIQNLVDHTATGDKRPSVTPATSRPLARKVLTCPNFVTTGWYTTLVQLAPWTSSCRAVRARLCPLRATPSNAYSNPLPCGPQSVPFSDGLRHLSRASGARCIDVAFRPCERGRTIRVCVVLVSCSIGESREQLERQPTMSLPRLRSPSRSLDSQLVVPMMFPLRRMVRTSHCPGTDCSTERDSSGNNVYEYQAEVRNDASGALLLQVPAGVVTDADGNPNTASNVLHLTGHKPGHWFDEEQNRRGAGYNRTIKVGAASATEGTDGTIDFTVTLRSRDDCVAATVDWATSDGTATAGEDYTASSGTLTFAPGETVKTISIVLPPHLQQLLEESSVDPDDPEALPLVPIEILAFLDTLPPAVDREFEVTVKVPAGVATDSLGNSNTASGPFVIAAVDSALGDVPDGEPAQGTAARPLCRPHQRAHDEGEPVTVVLLLIRLRADARASKTRHRRHAVCPCPVRHAAAEA